MSHKENMNHDAMIDCIVMLPFLIKEDLVYSAEVNAKVMMENEYLTDLGST